MTTFFSKFGKSVNDLFDVEKYAAGPHSAKLKTSTGLDKIAKGLTLVHTHNVAAGAVDSDFEALYKNAEFGQLSVVGHSNLSVCSELRLTKLAPNTHVTLEAWRCHDECGQGVAADVQYTHDKLAALELGVNSKEQTATAAVAVGVEGVAVGGQVVLARGDGKVAVQDYNGGLQYRQGDLTATLVTEDQAQGVKASALFQYNKHVQLAATAAYHFNKPAAAAAAKDAKDAKEAKDAAVVAAVGARIQCGSAAVTQATLSVGGALAVRLEQQVQPWAKLILTGTTNVLTYQKPAFGVALRLGDTADDE